MLALPNPLPDDPLPTASEWLAAAHGLKRANANALALATADAHGRPAVRMVLLKELAPKGYAVFYTNYRSRKAAELESAGYAAGVLYWHELGRQIRVEGRVVPAPPAESDAYFATRARQSQLNAWASEQSQPLTEPTELAQRAAAIAARYPGLVPRPPHWGGYRLWFEALELWVEGVGRFHERVRYERTLEPASAENFVASHWTHQRLQP